MFRNLLVALAMTGLLTTTAQAGIPKEICIKVPPYGEICYRPLSAV